MSENGKPRVVVTTKHRGVFFGTLDSREPDHIVLTDSRMCVYWSRETKGVVGLANTGPLHGSKVTQSAPKIELVDVTAIMHCTDSAVDKWESAPWG